jgi:hypothetical protein
MENKASKTSGKNNFVSFNFSLLKKQSPAKRVRHAQVSTIALLIIVNPGRLQP